VAIASTGSCALGHTAPEAARPSRPCVRCVAIPVECALEIRLVCQLEALEPCTLVSAQVEAAAFANRGERESCCGCPGPCNGAERTLEEQPSLDACASPLSEPERRNFAALRAFQARLHGVAPCSYAVLDRMACFATSSGLSWPCSMATSASGGSSEARLRPPRRRPDRTRGYCGGRWRAVRGELEDGHQRRSSSPRARVSDCAYEHSHARATARRQAHAHLFAHRPPDVPFTHCPRCVAA